ncbi:MAG: hypothetical protein ACOZQL_15290 [Myxococcota bacterium]
MKKTLLLSLSLLACTKGAPPPAAPPAATKEPVVVDDCTFATELVPGIPGSPGHLLPSEINPNGASELATLMRTFVAHWKETRAKLLAGETPPAPRFPGHRKIRCSWPTDPKDRTEAFDQLAQAYLAAVKAYDAAPSKSTFTGVINGCAACHEATCGGPLELIDSLRLPPEDAGR